MRWEDERYIRLYTRDTTDWLALSFDAQALFALLLRKVDRAGLLVLGKHGKRGVAIAIGHPREWERLGPALEELLADGCVRLTDDGGTLLVPNFIEAQEARASDKARQQKARETAAALAAAQSVTPRDAASRPVTQSHTPSREVTPPHAASHDVTPSHAVPSHAVPKTTTSSAGADLQEPEELQDVTEHVDVLQAPLLQVASKPAERPEDLQALWNAEAHKALPRWQGMSVARKRHAAARLRERPLAEWLQIIRRISASAFCRGEIGDRGWKASPDWLLQPDTADRVLEGKYDHAGQPAAPQPAGVSVGRGGTADECLGCGAHGEGANCGGDGPERAWLGYRCGCCSAWAQALQSGWTYQQAHEWASERRAGRAA